jgi:hypothetical protein
MRARMLVVCAAAAALGATPAPDALAHTVSPPSPRAGNGGSVFTFKGRAWQPSRRITASYFRRETDTRPFRRLSFLTTRRGRFTFQLVNPWFFDTGRTQRMCFSQFDTRYGRRYGKCQRFYVAPASAYFMPADGVVGGRLFILVVNGFQAGHTLSVELTRPDGVVETFSMTTRTRSGFVTGGEFGPLYVLRGGAFLRFQSDPTDQVGLYTAFVFDPNARARARAAVLVGSG